MRQQNDFDETFNEYHDLIRKEIAKDTDLDIKLAKVEQLVLSWILLWKNALAKSTETKLTG